MTVHELPPPTIVWLTKKEAAAHAKMSEGSIDRARRAGELDYSGGGGYVVRIRLDRLDEWIESRGRNREVD